MTKQPWVRRWEGLPARTQAMVVFPIMAVVMFLLHIGPLNQPFWRTIGYTLFWGAVGTAALVAASRAERARRAEAERGQRREQTDDE